MATTARMEAHRPQPDTAAALRALCPSANLANVAAICWREAAATPGHACTVLAAAIAHELGRDPRSVRRWLDQLATLGLVRILDRNRTCGAYTLAVADPRTVARARLHQPATAEAQQPLPFAEPDQPDQPPAILAMPQTSAAPRGEYENTADSADAVSAHRGQRGPAVRDSRTFAERSPNALEIFQAAGDGAQVATMREIIAAARLAAGGQPLAPPADAGTPLATRAKDLRPKDLLETKDLDIRPRPKDFAEAVRPAPAGGNREPDQPDQPATIGSLLAAAGALGTDRAAHERRRALVDELARDLGAGPHLAAGFWSNLAAVLDEPDADGRRRFDRREVLRILAYARGQAPDDPQRRARIFSKSAMRRARECGLEWPRAP